MPTWRCSCGAGPFPYEGAIAMRDAFDEHVTEAEATEHEQGNDG